MAPHRLDLLPARIAAADKSNTPVQIAVFVDYQEPARLGLRHPQRGGEITLRQGLGPVLKESLISSLQDAGVEVVADSAAETTLTVRVLKFEYAATKGFLLKTVQSAEFEAVASRGGSQNTWSFTRENERKFLLPPSEKTNTQMLNSLVEDMVAAMLRDRDLMAFLLKS